MIGQTLQLTLSNHRDHRPVHVCLLPAAFAGTGTHCACPRRDGQAEMTWLAGYIPVWFLLACIRRSCTRISTSWARRRSKPLNVTATQVTDMQSLHSSDQWTDSDETKPTTIYTVLMIS